MVSKIAHKSLSENLINQKGQEKASRQSQTSLDVEVKMGDQVGCT